MVTRIDAFAHAFPPELREELEEHHPTPGLGLMEAPRFWDVDHRLADLDEFGIDRQAIMLGRTGIWAGLSPEEAIDFARLGNDGIRELADEAPERLIPVGTLPFLEGEYLDEFERCVDDLDLAGVQIMSNIRGRPLDEFPAFFEKAAELDAPVWIHPCSHPYFDWTDEYVNDKIFGWLFETSLAQSRLVFSGLMERLPELKIITHHMGAMVPFFIERIGDFYSAYDDAGWAELSKPIEDYFRMFYGDTVLNGAVAPLACGLDFYGPEGLVFGTDYPFGPEKGRKWMREIPAAVDQLDLDEAGRERVYEGNVTELIG